MVSFLYSNNFIDIYSSVLLENISNIVEIENAKDFIKEIKKTEKNPYLSAFLKKENFKVNEAKIIDSEGEWDIFNEALLSFEDGSNIKIWANGSYWWIESNQANGERKRYFYYLD